MKAFNIHCHAYVCRPQQCFLLPSTISEKETAEPIDPPPPPTQRVLVFIVSDLTAPSQFSKRRVRVTWEAEGWEEGEENATELESAEPAQLGSNAYDDSDGFYGSVADTRSAESQQVSDR